MQHRPQDDPRQALLGSLARRFDLIDDTVFGAAFAALGQGHDDLGDLLVARGHLTADQLALLRPLADLLALREADRQFAELCRASGQVSDEEIEYAFAAQEAAFRRDRGLRSIGDLLVELGALDEAFRDELLAQQGRRPH